MMHLLLAVLLPASLSQSEVDAVVKKIDDLQTNTGDWRATAFVEQREKDRVVRAFELALYRRREGRKLVLMFTKPSSEAGKGYLRLDKNLFIYDPKLGQWERRTEREKIGGTESRRVDFDESTLAQDFTARYLGPAKLGKFQVHHLELEARPGADVPYPKLQIWVDVDTNYLLKRQEFAPSGRLMRTLYFPKWEKLENVHYPKEVRIFDEVQKGNRTTIQIGGVDLGAVADSNFTKGFIEQNSR
jgi:hypothetical protein